MKCVKILILMVMMSGIYTVGAAQETGAAQSLAVVSFVPLPFPQAGQLAQIKFCMLHHGNSSCHSSAPSAAEAAGTAAAAAAAP